MKCNGQVALVTSASRGIGHAVAIRLAANGAAVGVNYSTSAAAAEALVQEIRTSGGRAVAVQADVSDEAQVKEMASRVTAAFGPVTILVNNAGIVAQATLDTYNATMFERLWRVNVLGLIHATRAVVNGMRDLHYGRIINMTSIGGLGTAVRQNAFYSATKAEVISFTKRFAMELGLNGITVNAVAPGFILTEMTQEWLKQQPPDIERQFAPRTMVGRNGRMEDIAHAVAFLASPEAEWITAQVLTVDGGRMDYI